MTTFKRQFVFRVTNSEGKEVHAYYRFGLRSAKAEFKNMTPSNPERSVNVFEIMKDRSEAPAVLT